MFTYYLGLLLKGFAASSPSVTLPRFEFLKRSLEPEKAPLSLLSCALLPLAGIVEFPRWFVWGLLCHGGNEEMFQKWLLSERKLTPITNGARKSSQWRKQCNLMSQKWKKLLLTQAAHICRELLRAGATEQRRYPVTRSHSPGQVR